MKGLLTDKDLEDEGILELLMDIPRQEPSNDGPSADDFISDLQRIAQEDAEADFAGMFPDPSESYARRYRTKSL